MFVADMVSAGPGNPHSCSLNHTAPMQNEALLILKLGSDSHVNPHRWTMSGGMKVVSFESETMLPTIERFSSRVSRNGR